MKTYSSVSRKDRPQITSALIDSFPFDETYFSETPQDEIDAAFAQYYESAYGWALDEAEAHGVILDKRGAQTTSEKNSWAEFVRRAEENQQAALNEGQTAAEEPTSSDESLI